MCKFIYLVVPLEFHFLLGIFYTNLAPKVLWFNYSVLPRFFQEEYNQENVIVKNTYFLTTLSVGNIDVLGLNCNLKQLKIWQCLINALWLLRQHQRLADTKRKYEFKNMYKNHYFKNCMNIVDSDHRMVTDVLDRDWTCNKKA